MPPKKKKEREPRKEEKITYTNQQGKVKKECTVRLDRCKTDYIDLCEV